MVIERAGEGFKVPAHQALATKTLTPPVSGTEYTVLDTTKNVRLISAMAYVEWTVQPDPLVMKVYIDGQTLTFTQNNPVTATVYNIDLISQGLDANQAMATAATNIYKAFVIEGRSVKVTATITGGTVQTLISYVRYAKW